MTEHISKQFDHDLESIRTRMLQMGGLVESHIRAATLAFLHSDPDAAAKVVEGDARVNELELAIDGDLGQVIVRRQPAASDLRFILAAGKIVTDLERIGDEAAKIARMARDLQHAAPLQPPRLVALGHLSEVAIGMLREALDAFARLDAAGAAHVCGEDAAIDDEFRAIIRQLK